MYDSSADQTIKANQIGAKRARAETWDLEDSSIGAAPLAKRARYEPENGLSAAAEGFLLAREHVLPQNNAIQAKLVARQK